MGSCSCSSSCSSERCPCPCRGWNKMGFEVPPNPSHSVSQRFFFIATFPRFSTEILFQPSLPVSSGERGGKNVSGGIGLQLVLGRELILCIPSSARPIPSTCSFHPGKDELIKHPSVRGTLQLSCTTDSTQPPSPHTTTLLHALSLAVLAVTNISHLYFSTSCNVSSAAS